MGAVVDSLETGGGLDTVGASFRLFVVVAGSFAWAAWGVAISQSIVFRKGLHDYIGPGFSRVQAILVLPSLAAVFALVLGFLASDLARDILADPTAMLSSRVDAITMGFVVFSLAIVAVPVASVVAMRRDVTTAGGFRRGLLASIAGIVPGLVVFAWLCLQLTGR